MRGLASDKLLVNMMNRLNGGLETQVKGYRGSMLQLVTGFERILIQI